MSFITESGIANIGKIPWGSHFCQFYRDKTDLAEILVPYFIAGLANHERCIWVTSTPYGAQQAAAGLGEALPDFKLMKNKGQITICEFEDWYLGAGLSRETTMQRWLTEEQQALASGYRGLRVSGNTSFVDHRAWGAFMDHEKRIQEGVNGRRVIALCSYDSSKLERSHECDVFENHHFGIGRNHERWEILD